MKASDDPSRWYFHRASDGSIEAAHGNCRSYAAPTDTYRLLDLLPHDARHLRLLGTADNADIINTCRRLRPDIAIELASPIAVCPMRWEQDRPAIVIQRMRQCLLAGRLGGFHTFHAAIDGPTYVLVHAVYVGHSDARLAELFLDHPAAADLQFVGTLARVPAAKLLARIIDPRWYVDLAAPDRVRRLPSYLGLSPKKYRRMLEGSTGSHGQACRLVRDTWHCDPPGDTDDPRNFLWRIQQSHGGYMGEFAAGQCLLTFLQRTWQQRIAWATMPHLTEPLFIPELLFREDEAQAYRQFTSRPG